MVLALLHPHLSPGEHVSGSHWSKEEETHVEQTSTQLNSLEQSPAEPSLDQLNPSQPQMGEREINTCCYKLLKCQVCLLCSITAIIAD